MPTRSTAEMAGRAALVGVWIVGHYDTPSFFQWVRFGLGKGVRTIYRQRITAIDALRVISNMELMW